MVYEYTINDGSMNGYVNFSLSSFKVSDFPANEVPLANLSGALNYTKPFCRLVNKTKSNTVIKNFYP